MQSSVMQQLDLENNHLNVDGCQRLIKTWERERERERERPMSYPFLTTELRMVSPVSHLSTWVRTCDCSPQYVSYSCRVRHTLEIDAHPLITCIDWVSAEEREDCKDNDNVFLWDFLQCHPTQCLSLLLKLRCCRGEMVQILLINRLTGIILC